MKLHTKEGDQFQHIMSFPLFLDFKILYIYIIALCKLSPQRIFININLGVRILSTQITQEINTCNIVLDWVSAICHSRAACGSLTPLLRLSANLVTQPALRPETMAQPWPTPTSLTRGLVGWEWDPGGGYDRKGNRSAAKERARATLAPHAAPIWLLQGRQGMHE